MLVATAAPTTPSRGNGPTPKMSIGPRKMLIAFASQSTRIAITASPAPRKIALTRNSINTTAFPPSMMRVKFTLESTPDDAPIALKSDGAVRAPLTPSTAEIRMASRIACAAACEAPSGSRSPIRRATVAVAPMPSPIARV